MHHPQESSTKLSTDFVGKQKYSLSIGKLAKYGRSNPGEMLLNSMRQDTVAA
jgi:hypothetical protein